VIEGLWGLSRHDCPTSTTRGGTNTGAGSETMENISDFLSAAGSNEILPPTLKISPRSFCGPGWPGHSANLATVLATAQKRPSNKVAIN
jgi:hypothetical protein